MASNETAGGAWGPNRSIFHIASNAIPIRSRGTLRHLTRTLKSESAWKARARTGTPSHLPALAGARKRPLRPQAPAGAPRLTCKQSRGEQVETWRRDRCPQSRQNSGGGGRRRPANTAASTEDTGLSALPSSSESHQPSGRRWCKALTYPSPFSFAEMFVAPRPPRPLWVWAGGGRHRLARPELPVVRPTWHQKAQDDFQYASRYPATAQDGVRRAPGGPKTAP